MDAAQREQVTQGTVLIVRFGNHYALVPEVHVSKIRERDPNAVVSSSPAPTAAADENDPYKDFKVPDDLIW